MTPVDLSEHTITLATVVKMLAPVVSAALFSAGWIIKRTVGKLDEGLAAVISDVDELATDCRKELADLRKECRDCQRDRQKEREDCVDTYGKFGARLTKVETEHAIHHRGGISV